LAKTALSARFAKPAAMTAGADLFEWWAQMIEVPVVAEGGLTDDALRSLAPFADFVALGAEVWSADDPAARLAEIAALVSDGAG